MSAKAALDTKNAGVVEEKANKELASKARDEKKKEDANVELARNPELPVEEKLNAEDVASVLAPAAAEKEKGEEKAQVEDKKKGEEEKTKEEAKPAEGVKKVEDPEKVEGEKEHKGEEKGELKEEKTKDKLVVGAEQAENEDKRALGDIYFVASLSALANTDRSMLEKNCKANGDGTYTVTFYEKDPKAESGYKAHEIVVTPETAGPEEKTDEDGKSDELLAIITQAYTDWRGGADKVGEGKGGEAMEALTAEPTEYLPAESSNADGMWATLIEACNWNQAIVATSRGEDVKALFSESDMKPWHAYVVLKCKEVNGKKMVTLRNPFAKAGASEGNVIEVDLEKFAKLYRGISISGKLPEKDAPAKKDDKAQSEATA
ncbi:MAG: hypothetical protein AUK47_11310 [Deltaproteobacteria bacterium CG2_30_63_29]|nr:MAG: hypothetical protein AUK47_11310 [Deltaproteobacteria bacterium CG2_30_63_29]PJB36398.1 MAG: hypothetical protein CO108_23500 [Deltaproteobacteria bacterium CG_4_9_14_3_um_filter_63_12]